MASAHTRILNEIMLACPRNARLVPQTTVKARLPNGRVIKGGLGAGSPDLVGGITLHGFFGRARKPVMVALAVEVKTPASPSLRRDQKRWLRQIERMGGIAIKAQSAAEFTRKLGEALKKLEE